ncbi:MAG: GTPase HflX [Verrucomicrobia bacterium]|nr:GTPase HflX [Verrucomicrobiota bacterium]
MKALLSNTRGRVERVFLIGIELKRDDARASDESLDELAELARTVGAEVAGEGVQRLDAPHPATFIGRGKAGDFARQSKALDADAILFDDDLTAAQARNLEEIFGCRVMDRTSLILDIFARRARTNEGKLQVELAQLEYLLPRLTRYWTHLSRQRGGLGAIGGEGESQLETDRRKTQERIEKIREALDLVQRQRTTQRRGRQRSHWPLASIVGYTNAGKSTLFNALTGSHVLEEDKLFATLDPTTRRLRLPTNQNVLLSDTVGFIRKLPHGLVEAFKATLEEVVEADLLVHVVDITQPDAEEQIAAVNTVLDELRAADKPVLMVFNKTDLLAGTNVAEPWLARFPGSVALSARTRDGFSALLAELGTRLRPVRRLVQLSVPHANPAVIARVHALGQVVSSNFEGPTARLTARIPPHVMFEFERFLVHDDDHGTPELDRNGAAHVGGKPEPAQS